MDALAAATAIGPPLGVVGAAFYFSPEAGARAEGIGLDVVSLYAAGRGAVLGDRTPAEVDETFFFFKSGLIAGVVEAARAKAAPADILGAHLGSADDFAVATYGAVDPAVLAAFDAAAARVVEPCRPGGGRWSTATGPSRRPGGPPPSAYRHAVLLRELRGGIHREAVEAAGLSAAVACQFDRGDDYYRLHGFGDDDRVPGTPDDAGRPRRCGAGHRRGRGRAAGGPRRGASSEDLVAGAELLAATGPGVVLPGT